MDKDRYLESLTPRDVTYLDLNRQSLEDALSDATNALDSVRQAKAATHAFDFDHSDGHYLFGTGSDHRAYSISQWTAAIKSAFGRHSPNGEAPPPKLLRSSFITFLRSSERAPEVLRSAAGVMKHALDTSASDGV